MPRVLASVIAGTVAVLVVACGGAGSGSNGGGSLDCGWLGSDNCWKVTASAAVSCLPAASASGTLSPDGQTCTFTTGQVVTFNPALTLPLPQNPTFNFTVASGGQTCFAFQQPNQQTFVMTSSAGTTTVNASAASTYSVSCPGGAQYTSTDPLALLGCDAGFFGGLPGTSFSSTSTSVSFMVIGTGGDGGTGTTPIFDCQRGP
ncbi:MAG TPA: hypothetical protein VIF09_19955 [Polyangiaceae bacterium]|jgi:hypothetical protein